MNKDEALKMAYKAEETGNLQDLVDAVNMLVEVVEASEQPAQEPVACEKCNGKGYYQSGIGEVQCENCKGSGFDFSELHQTIVDNYVLTSNNHAPSWQVLSDDEINSFYEKIKWNVDIKDIVIDFARAIEQALRSKNANNSN